MTKDKITKQDLWTEIKILNAKLDKVLDLLQQQSLENKVEISAGEIPKIQWPKEFFKDADLGYRSGSIQGKEYTQKCVFDNISLEDRLKPMSISCPCKKCTPYCLSSGSLSDSGTVQIWNKEKPVDCISTTFIPSGDLSIE